MASLEVASIKSGFHHGIWGSQTHGWAATRHPETVAWCRQSGHLYRSAWQVTMGYPWVSRYPQVLSNLNENNDDELVQLRISKFQTHICIYENIYETCPHRCWDPHHESRQIASQSLYPKPWDDYDPKPWLSLILGLTTHEKQMKQPQKMHSRSCFERTWQFVGRCWQLSNSLVRRLPRYLLARSSKLASAPTNTEYHHHHHHDLIFIFIFSLLLIITTNII